MHNLDNIVRIYYSAVSACTILNKKVRYRKFPRDEFSRLYKVYGKHYSETESAHLYAYAESSIHEMGHPFARMDKRQTLNVFAALEELAEQLLTLDGHEVRCHYDDLLRFRDIAQYIDEDLLVCAYLAMYNKKYNKIIYPDFRWDTVIGHNNVQLRHIMARGISDNHFHLFGSAPHFHLLWIYAMNHVGSEIIRNLACEINRRQRNTREHYSVEYTEDRFEIKILKAALIRLCIVCYLADENMMLCDRLPEYVIDNILSGEWDIQAYYIEIHRMLDDMRNCVYFQAGKDISDYACYMVDGLNNVTVERYWFAGERWLLYKMLDKELLGVDEKEEKYYQWFYAYLVLKNNIRDEIVQSNDTVGFDNFSVYSKRKHINLEKIIEAAVYGSMESGNVRSLEIRIKPEEQAYDNARYIKWIDDIIARRETRIPKDRYYYVFHFSKNKDWNEGKVLPDKCRHYVKRRQLRRQAVAITEFRRRYRELAAEVLGIDACSQEIGCRPEVFARVFRYLSLDIVENIIGMEEVKVGQLKKTFHVGEDFLDVVDGLRAIDEAVHFLNLQYGDRIGHGTVLGIDARKWYAFKQNTILLTKQDFLDNTVWLYQKLAEYEIAGMVNLRAELLREFELCFAEVYLNGDSRDAPESLRYNIHAYYEAWKLRGDEPELYLGGYFDKDEIQDRWWLVNDRYPEKFESRMHKEIAHLYYLYHYDEKVRKKGAESKEIRVSPMLIEGVCAVQKAMQREFAALGIGIESNPSSNVAISTIQGYDEHPIAAFYNKDLTWDREQLGECPQIYVSINTDNRGVFHTSLENEYALMACALEKVKDSHGNSVYNRQMIYQWIDNIRQMGNMQSFREAEYEATILEERGREGRGNGRSIGEDNFV